MITSARIEALRQDTDLGWLTALRAPAVAALAAEDGPLRLSLFDQFDLAEITGPTLRASASSPPRWPRGGWPGRTRAGSKWGGWSTSSR